MNENRVNVYKLDKCISDFRGQLLQFSLQVRDFDGVLAQALENISNVLFDANNYCESLLEEETTQPMGVPTNE